MKMKLDPILLYELTMCIVALVILIRFHIQQRRERRQKGKHDTH